MRHFIFLAAGLSLVLCGPSTRESWIDICTSDSGNQCCTGDGEGMTTGGTNHEYWIMKQSGSWSQLDLLCRTERPGSNGGGSRLAIFESKRENDCVAKYLIKEFEDSTAKQYAIGIRDESDYPFIYEWHRVSDATKASLTFQNWDNASPIGNSCVVMTAGASDPKNGRWTDVDCSTTATYYGVCEWIPDPTAG